MPGLERVWSAHVERWGERPRVLRGWHMFRDVGGDGCVLGLVDASGRRRFVDDGDDDDDGEHGDDELNDDDVAAFAEIARAGAPVDDDSPALARLCARPIPLSPAWFCAGQPQADAFRCGP